MARARYFTRTIKSKEVTATVINPITHELSTITLTIPEGADVKGYIDANTNNILVSVEQVIEVSDVYQMTLEKFMANAVKVENNAKGD